MLHNKSHHMFVNSLFKNLNTVTLNFSHHTVRDAIPYPNRRKKVLSNVDVLARGMAEAWPRHDWSWMSWHELFCKMYKCMVTIPGDLWDNERYEFCKAL